MNNYSMSSELPVVLPITKIVDECHDIRTFFFKHSIDFKPGQFVMVWIPEVDEKPFTISYYNKDSFGISVQMKGKFTKRLYEMKLGDKVGIRGPYGNGFDVSIGKKKCVVGGGCGTAPIAPLLDILDNPIVIIGARSKANIIFQKRYPDAIFMTDDGSFGRKGFTTEALVDIIEKDKPDIVYMCGPEVMMAKVFEICEQHKITVQASLERYMKCGFGVCGQCVCGGNLVCKDGPVSNSEQLRSMDDFGKFARTKTGQKVTLKEYHGL